MGPKYTPDVLFRIMKSCYAPSHCSGCVERRDCDGRMDLQSAKLIADRVVRAGMDREISMRRGEDDSFDAVRYHQQMMLEPFKSGSLELGHIGRNFNCRGSESGRFAPLSSSLKEYFINGTETMKEVAEAMLRTQKKLAPWQVPMLPAIPQMKKIISGDPVTVVIWMDDTKTIVRRSEDTPYSEYNAVAAAVCEKMFGSNTKFKKDIAKKLEKQKPKKVKASKVTEADWHEEYQGQVAEAHASDCATNNEPAYPAGACDCGAVPAYGGEPCGECGDECNCGVDPTYLEPYSVPDSKNPSIERG